MATSDLRDMVREYINTRDEGLLKIIKALAQSDLNDEKELTLSEKQYQMIDKRREAYLRGKSKPFTWEQVKENTRNCSNK